MRLPGTMYLIDTSAAARMGANPSVQTLIEQLIDEGVAVTCITVDLEAGYSVRNGSDVANINKARAECMRTLPMTDGIAKRALEVQALLGSRGMHRAAGSFDLLTAATAEYYRAIVLHYDADFEHIASVTGQRHQWIAPPGSID